MSVLVEVRDDRLPTIVHWGPDLGEQTPEDFAAVVLGLARCPRRARWRCVPGRGDARALDWMDGPAGDQRLAPDGPGPPATCTAVRLDGTPVGSAGGDPPLVNAGPASVAVDAETRSPSWP